MWWLWVFNGVMKVRGVLWIGWWYRLILLYVIMVGIMWVICWLLVVICISLCCC